MCWCLAAKAHGGGHEEECAVHGRRFPDHGHELDQRGQGRCRTLRRSVQTVAAAAEELCGSFAEVGRQATLAKDVDDQRGQAGGIAARADVVQLRRLADSISQATALIDNIAQQTNLLALNASIEAAHAGAQGKGFAVVAQEIKLLSNQTAKATGDISSQISNIQQMVELMANGIIELGGTMKEVEDISISVAGAVEEQTLVTRDITKNMVEVAQSSDQIAASINDVRCIADSCESKTHEVMDVDHGHGRSDLKA